MQCEMGVCYAGSSTIGGRAAFPAAVDIPVRVSPGTEQRRNWGRSND